DPPDPPSFPTRRSSDLSQIIIGPGASLAVYVGGASAVFTQVNNQGRAKDFSYYGLPSNTSVTFGGNAALIGTIYCPNADFTLGRSEEHTSELQSRGHLV